MKKNIDEYGFEINKICIKCNKIHFPSYKNCTQCGNKLVYVKKEKSEAQP